MKNIVTNKKSKNIFQKYLSEAIHEISWQEWTTKLEKREIKRKKVQET